MHVKLYSSRARLAPDGTKHELGFDVDMDMDDFDILMDKCAAQRVLPLMLVLRRTTASDEAIHFQAVRFPEKL